MRCWARAARCSRGRRRASASISWVLIREEGQRKAYNGGGLRWLPRGNTVVVVTHEDDIAQHARRVIRLRDGKVESDVRVDEPTLAHVDVDGILGAAAL